MLEAGPPTSPELSHSVALLCLTSHAPSLPPTSLDDDVCALFCSRSHHLSPHSIFLYGVKLLRFKNESPA